MSNPVPVHFDVRKADDGGWVCEVKLYDQLHHFGGKDPAECVGKAVAFLGEENITKVEVGFRNSEHL